MNLSTITAIATPAGSGGIGIIRISGEKAMEIARAVFQPSRDQDPEAMHSHRLYHGWVTDRSTRKTIDEVLMVYMQSPRSYTREDVVEIHTHNGPATLKATLELVLRHGARLAEPGEFTRRAYLNGRIDLTQAEAVVDIINARTMSSLEIAATHIQGVLKEAVLNSRRALFDIQAEIAAAIDFPEEAEEALDPELTAERLNTLIISPMKAIRARFAVGRFLREGLRVVVTGLPNVGKSSLMNRLLERERAIVTPYPGTTRDFIEENLEIEGFPALIVDTAGLRETQDPVERIGVDKTLQKIREADLILFMVDATQPIENVFGNGWIPVKDKPTILVVNKMDLVDDFAPENLPDPWQETPLVRISVLHDQGIDTLKEAIVDRITQGRGFMLENPVVPNARQKEALDRAMHAAEAAAEGLVNGLPVELVSMEIGAAHDALGEILGDGLRTDLLDAIFSRFCIGK